jgi:hypothetical protein
MSGPKDGPAVPNTDEIEKTRTVVDDSLPWMKKNPNVAQTSSLSVQRPGLSVWQTEYPKSDKSEQDQEAKKSTPSDRQWGSRRFVS